MVFFYLLFFSICVTQIRGHFYFSTSTQDDGCHQGTLEQKPTIPLPGNPSKGSTYYIFLPTFRSDISEHLWNSTEVEDALVAQAGQVGNNIRDMPQRISD